MRYSRMKEQNIHHKENTSVRSGGWIFILILAAAVIYVITATKAGEYLSEKVITPTVEFFTHSAEKQPAKEASATVFSEQKELDSEEISFPATADYLLQYGVFSSKENAESAASELITIGGAGYIRDENGQFRVIISGYSTKEDALNVKERLLSDRNMQTKLIELAADAMNFTISSEPEHISTVKKISSDLSSSHKELLNSVLELDKGNLSNEDASAILQKYKETLKESIDLLSSLSENTDDPLIKALQKYHNTADQSVDFDDPQLKGAALSAAMKRAYIGSAYAYYDLLRYDTND